MGEKFFKYQWRKFSGKTHLVNIFIKKFNGVKFDASSLADKDLKVIKIHENIVLEDLDENIDEKLIYSLLNIIDLDNKFIISYIRKTSSRY